LANRHRRGSLDAMSEKSSKPMTYQRLERAAYHYLQRFASSREGLRRVLERKIRRTNDGFAPPDAEQEGWIAELVEKCEAMGLLDDAAYAAAKARGLARQGKSHRHIRSWLKARGLGEESIEGALSDLADEAGTSQAAEVAAALRLAKRRRIGPYRRAPLDATAQRREMGVLARAGFSLSLARAVVQASDEAALAELCDLDPSRLADAEEGL